LAEARDRGWADRLRGGAGYPAAYMFVVTFVCAGALIGLARLTRERVTANRRIAFERAVLQAAGMTVGPDASPARVHRLFTDRVEQAAGGALRVRTDAGRADALPFEGQGFWNVIRGVVGVEPGGERLTGMAVYEQSETPGLGAEIVKPRFREPFAGLRLGSETPVRIRPPGAALGPGEVHGVTGATETCTRLERILNRRLKERGGQDAPGSDGLGRTR